MTRVPVVAVIAAAALLASGCVLDPTPPRSTGGPLTTSVAAPRPRPEDLAARPEANATAAGATVMPAGVDGAVTRHTDGDTVRVDGVKVRLIGIDTPEVKTGPACYGRAAAARTATLLPLGTKVRLVYDVERQDRYGRTLAYLYRQSDGLFVNAELLRGGFASVLTVPPNVAHASSFLTLQRQARADSRGLWSACAAVSSRPAAPPRATPGRRTARLRRRTASAARADFSVSPTGGADRRTAIR